MRTSDGVLFEAVQVLMKILIFSPTVARKSGETASLDFRTASARILAKCALCGFSGMAVVQTDGKVAWLQAWCNPLQVFD